MDSAFQIPSLLSGFLVFQIVFAPQTEVHVSWLVCFVACMRWMRCFGGFESRDRAHPSMSNVPERVCFYVSFLFCFCSPVTGVRLFRSHFVLLGSPTGIWSVQSIPCKHILF